jgi:hypothetical protein
VNRHDRQLQEGVQWCEDLSEAAYCIGIYVSEANMEEFAKQMLYQNRDEGGELMEPDAKKFLLDYITEVLSD